MRWLAIALCALGCASPTPPPVRLDDWMRVGVDPTQEAARVQEARERAGWETRQRLEGRGFVALGFARGEQRAVRVVTRRGIALALDSHETDGVRPRHGAVRLVEPAEPDVDGDGAPEVLVAQGAQQGACLALLRIDDEGRLRLAPDDAAALQPGRCVTAFRDLDGDGVVEALTTLRWPDLALDGEVPSLDAALVLEDGGFRARGGPSAYVAAEREAREAALARARAGRRLGEALRLAVELTALAHLEGATVARQVERFDAALAGLVLTEEAAARFDEARALVAAGWGVPDEPAMSSGPDEQEEDTGRAARLPQPQGDQDP